MDFRQISAFLGSSRNVLNTISRFHPTKYFLLIGGGVLIFIEKVTGIFYPITDKKQEEKKMSFGKLHPTFSFISS